MVKTSTSGDAYEEYMRFDNEDGSVLFEQIGDTTVDLSDYVKTEVTDNLANLINANTQSISTLQETVNNNTNKIALIETSITENKNAINENTNN